MSVRKRRGSVRTTGASIRRTQYSTSAVRRSRRLIWTTCDIQWRAINQKKGRTYCVRPKQLSHTGLRCAHPRIFFLSHLIIQLLVQGGWLAQGLPRLKGAWLPTSHRAVGVVHQRLVIACRFFVRGDRQIAKQLAAVAEHLVYPLRREWDHSRQQGREMVNPLK